MGWVEQGWVEEGWVESDGVGAVNLIFSGPNDRQRGGSIAGTQDGILIPHLKPRAPYGVEVIVALYNYMGLRLFGFTMISDLIIADDIGRYDTLLAVDPIEFGTGSVSGNILGRVGLNVRPLSRAVFSNLDKSWSIRWATEAILTTNVGIFIWFGQEGNQAQRLYSGNAERMTLSKRHFEMEFGRS